MLKKLIKKTIIKYHRFINKPLLMVMNESKIWSQYNGRSFTISFNRNVYIDCLLTAIDRTINISGKKPTVIKIKEREGR